MRDRLAPLYRETCCFTAYFNKFGRTAEGSNVLLLVNVKMDGKFAADHVWIHRSKQIKRLDLQRGDLVQFEAEVARYARGEPLYSVDEIVYDYGLEHVRDMRIIKRRETAYEPIRD